MNIRTNLFIELIYMSHDGAIKTDDVENGAAFFTDSPGVN